jgi:formylglycine-generating enzyme required for sulfatase activity/tRNA A-37 threonylcarbamoyl transferase component Bud32
MAEFKPGDVINNKFEVQGVLGEGGMGLVYKAREIGLDRLVAIKVPKDQYLTNKDFISRFKREAKLVAKLNHDNIVQLYDFLCTDELAYMALEFVQGKELGKYVQSAPEKLTIGGLVTILLKTSEGLTYAHEHGVVHRDIKPANILVEPLNSGAHRVKVMDFGIAHIEQGDLFTQQLTQLTADGASMGTPSYMSPEQVQGQPVTSQSDIYSLACVFYYCFTLKLLFEGSLFTVISQHVNTAPTPPNVYNPNLPEALVAVILKGLAKNPRDRWETALDMGRAVEKAMEPYATMRFVDFLPPEAVEGTMAIPIAGAATATANAPAPRQSNRAFTPSPAPLPALGPAFAPSATAGLGPTTPSSTMPGMAMGTDSTLGQFGIEPPSHGPYDQTVAHMRAVQPPSPTRWIGPLILVAALVIGGVALWMVAAKRKQWESFERALGAGDYLQVMQMARQLEDEQLAEAQSLVARRAEDALEQTRKAFMRNDPNGVSEQLDKATRLVDSIEPPLEVPGLSQVRDSLKAIREAQTALRRYVGQVEPAILRDLTLGEISEAEKTFALIRQTAEKALPSRYFMDQEIKLSEFRSRAPTPTPKPEPTRVIVTPEPVVTPVATPETGTRERRAFEELEETGRSGGLPPAEMLSRWQAFQARYPDFDRDRVIQKLAEYRRLKAISPAMVTIDQSLRFTMGATRSQDPQAGYEESPAHPVELSPYAIGKYEVPADAFAFFLNAEAKRDPRYGEAMDKETGQIRYMIPAQEDGMNTIRHSSQGWEPYPGKENYPANCVTWQGAAAYCAWLARETGQPYRLPTEAEWERAALGPNNNAFPWGNALDPARARYGQNVPGGSARPKFDQVLAEVDRLPEGATSEGVFHLAGNVMEWVQDWHGSYSEGAVTNPTGPAEDLDKVLRGGSWYTTDPKFLRAKGRERWAPDDSRDEIGFRVALPLQ